MKLLLCRLLFMLLSVSIASADAPDLTFSNRMTREEVLTSAKGIVLKGPDVLNTPEAFRPPVEITIVAKTDSTDLRIAYAADQVIFNWADDRGQLRVDGGPADGRHRLGSGHVPIGKYVTIRWVVTPLHQAIYVDDELRFEHSGDYSEISKCVSVFPAVGSNVTVKSIRVKQMAAVGPKKASGRSAAD